MYQLNPALRDFWRKPARNKVLPGGRASSKSHDAAGFAVYLAANYKLKFLCARQFQNRIAESVYTLIKDKIENSEYRNEFHLTNKTIIHKTTGSEFLFYGIARNLSEIKSTEGVDVLWLEEAHYLTEEQWETIEPTIRKEGSQVWVIFNPNEEMDFAYRYFVRNPPPDTVVRHINWDENPFLSETMLKIIRNMYATDPVKAEHIYGGVPKTGNDKSVISMVYIKAALDAHKHPTKGWDISGSKRIGFDVADDGDDLNAWCKMHGNVIVGAHAWEGLEDELLKSSTLVFNEALEFGSTITYDSIGVGAHVGSKMKELNEARNQKIQYDPFNAGGKVENPDKVYMELPHTKILNKDHFSNIKAQKWDEVATRFRKTHEYITQGIKHPIDELISIDSSRIDSKVLDQLMMELSAPRKDVDMMGKFKVEGKKDMLKRGIKSPNMADAVIMAAIMPKRRAASFFDF